MNAAPATHALALLAMLLAGSAQAGRFQHDLSAGLSAEYDSNPALSATAASAIWRFSASPGYRLTGAAGPDQWHAQLGLRLERSSDAALSAGRQDPSLSLAWSHQTPNGQFGVSGKYDEASTRATEFQDSGLVSVDGSRISRSLSANWLSELNERTSLSLDGGYADTAYGGAGLTDYRNVSLGATLSQAWSERSEPYLRLAASRYLPAVGAAANSYDALLGVRLKLSERLAWDLKGGVNQTAGLSDRSGWQGGIKLDYGFGPRSALSLDLGRSVSASGAGGVVEADHFTGGWNQALSERSSAGLDLSWRNSRSATPSTTRQLTLWASRALDPFWGLRLSYLYRQREGAGQGEADAHVLALVLSYAHPEFLNL